MSFDAGDAYNKWTKEIAAKRGWVQTGDASGTLVPNATWGEAITFYKTFLAMTSDPSSCMAKEMSQSPLDSVWGFVKAVTGNTVTAAVDQCLTFVKSSRFQSALAAFKAQDPMARAWKKWGMAYPAGLGLAMSQPYPYNAEFWPVARAYSSARVGAGAVQGNLNRAGESFVQAVKDLPSTIASVLPPPPDFDFAAKLIKIGLVVGVGILGYNLYQGTKPKR